MINSPINQTYIKQASNSDKIRINAPSMSTYQNSTKQTMPPAQQKLPAPVPIVIAGDLTTKQRTGAQILNTILSLGVSLIVISQISKIMNKYINNITSQLNSKGKKGSDSIWENIKNFLALEDLSLSQNLKDKVDNIIDGIQNPEFYISKGADKPSNAILLYGPAGTGKTTFAKALAKKLNGKFTTISISKFGSPYVNQSEINLQRTIDEICEYANAHKNEKIVVLVDEIDSIIMQDNGINNDHSIKLLNTFKECIEERLKKYSNIITIGTTNVDINPDKALQESGRQLDAQALSRFTKLKIDNPTAEQIRTTLARRYKKCPNVPKELSEPDSEILQKISQELYKMGISFRDLNNFANDAAFNNKKSPALSVDDLYAALEKLKIEVQTISGKKAIGFSA